MMKDYLTTPSPKRRGDKPFEVLITGAGVADLTAAYALRQSRVYQEGKLVIRLVEKRSGK